jgi:hypothetical protein
MIALYVTNKLKQKNLRYLVVAILFVQIVLEDAQIALFAEKDIKL